jgi:hypothetical protein
MLFVASFWVYDDAKKRNMNNAAWWAIFTFLILIIGFPLYLMERGNHPINGLIDLICPNCGKRYDSMYDFCPFCGTKKYQATYEELVDENTQDKNRMSFLSIFSLALGFISAFLGCVYDFDLSIYIGVFLAIIGLFILIIKK